MTLKQKEKFLIKHGWYTFRSPNNWFNDELMDDMILDSGGFRLDQAYEYQKEINTKFKMLAK